MLASSFFNISCRLITVVMNWVSYNHWNFSYESNRSSFDMFCNSWITSSWSSYATIWIPSKYSNWPLKPISVAQGEHEGKNWSILASISATWITMWNEQHNWVIQGISLKEMVTCMIIPPICNGILDILSNTLHHHNLLLVMMWV